MHGNKQRLTVTVDPDLVEAGHEAVEAGDAVSVSAWVSAAIEEKVARDRQLRELAAAIASYERDHGEITDQEIADQLRLDRENATVVRGRAQQHPDHARPA